MSTKEKEAVEGDVKEKQKGGAEEKASGENKEVPQREDSSEVVLQSLFAFKEGMSAVYDELGNRIPVTVLRYEPWVVTQVKTPEKEGYSALQVACGAKPAKRCTKAERNHFKAAGFENGARFVKEVRQEIPDSVKVGQRVSLQSLSKGDLVKVTSYSKGRGFSGAMKRWGFGGGPASHGAGFHRKPGSIGNCTWPGRVMKGRKMPGHYGNQKFTYRNIKVVDILPDENVILIKGPVPGAKNALVQITKG
ncbi:MAG: 50S ribosomal protein L3 [Bdellovibrio sp.]|nr:MAG: 50S ribosomal protein L3 [Bdellovibrio sp.]